MQYGLYLAASGALNGMHRMNVHANNLANVQTTGFQPYDAVTFQRAPERLTRPTDAPPKPILEQLGGSPWAAPVRLSATQGRVVETGQPLNVALVGEGYLLLGEGRSAGDVEPAPETLRLTRDGQLGKDAEGRLVHAASGRPVLDDRHRPINVPATGTLTIDGDGRLQVNGAPLATLGLVRPGSLEQVRRDGANLLAFEPGAGGRVTASLEPVATTVQQGHLEDSGVDPITTLNDLIDASRAARSGLRIMQYHDEIMGQAVGRLGRVS